MYGVSLESIKSIENESLEVIQNMYQASEAELKIYKKLIEK